MKRIQIGVMGPAMDEYPCEKENQEKIERTAEAIGELLAKTGAITFTGGCDGVMEAALRGAKKAGGLTVGMPGRTRGSSNAYVDVEIVCEPDIGSFLFAGLLGCDSLIFIPGGSGTLAELCLAYRNRKPIVVIRGFDAWYDKLIDGYLDNSKIVKIYGADTPEEAVESAVMLAKPNPEVKTCTEQ